MLYSQTKPSFRQLVALYNEDTPMTETTGYTKIKIRVHLLATYVASKT